MTVWILTLMLNGAKIYSDSGIFINKGACESLLSLMKSTTDGSQEQLECREVGVGDE